MNIKTYIIEKNNNMELYNYLKDRVEINNNLYDAQVVIVNKVFNVKLGFNIIDYALAEGKEIVCIKNNFAKEHYVCNYLIKNGAIYV